MKLSGLFFIVELAAGLQTPLGINKPTLTLALLSPYKRFPMRSTTKIDSSTSSNQTSDFDGLMPVIREYFQMTKPTIGMLVVITVIPSLIMAGSSLPGLGVTTAALLGTFLATSSSGIFNHLVDADIDSSMGRTKSRPLPSGKANKKAASALALTLGLASFIILYIWATPLAAWVALAANAFYVLGYTMYLKKRTVQNIVIGGAAGAVGPLIGWSAITGNLSLASWILFMIIFLWTPPHFWALAIKYKDDYAKANIPMMPSVRGVLYTQKQIFTYTLTLIPMVIALYALGAAGWLFLIGSLSMTLYFTWLAFRMYWKQDIKLAMPVFFYSCFYLFGIFGALTIDRILVLS